MGFSLNALFEMILFSGQQNASCNINTTLLAFTVLSKLLTGETEQTMAFLGAINLDLATKIITTYVTPFVNKLSSSISQSIEETK